MNSLSGLERIENANTQIGDVGSVTCHQCHAMNFGGRRQNAVDYWQLASGVEPPPFIGNRAIDRQNAFAKGLIHCLKSGLNRFGLSVVLLADSLDAFADFADH